MKKAQAENKYKQQLIQMDFDLFAAKMAGEVVTSKLAMVDEVESPEGPVHSFINKQRVQDYIANKGSFHLWKPFHVTHNRLSDDFAPLPTSLRVRNHLVPQPITDTDQGSEFAKILLKEDLFFFKTLKFRKTRELFGLET